MAWVGLCRCKIAGMSIILAHVFGVDERVFQGQLHKGGHYFRFHQTKGPFHASQKEHVGSDIGLVSWATGRGCFKGYGSALDSKQKA